jgi:DNA modification methylase
MFLSVQTKDTYAGSVNYVQEYAEKQGLEKPEADVREKALRNQELTHENFVPTWIGERTRINQGDARNLPFRDGAADLVVTSPPYMRVLSYTWNNWLRLWWMGKDREAERERLDITQDVEKYRAFMRECLGEMYRVMADESVAVLIVGDVKKSLAAGERTLNTAGYIAEEALNHTSFKVHGVIEDAYEVGNRGYVVFNQLKYAYNKDEKDEKAKVPIDRCLILKKGDPNLSAEPSINWSQEYYKQ